MFLNLLLIYEVYMECVFTLGIIGLYTALQAGAVSNLFYGES